MIRVNGPSSFYIFQQSCERALEVLHRLLKTTFFQLIAFIPHHFQFPNTPHISRDFYFETPRLTSLTGASYRFSSLGSTRASAPRRPSSPSPVPLLLPPGCGAAATLPCAQIE